ncbi:MAG: YraN family protein [Cytophagaceae bacterium]
MINNVTDGKKGEEIAASFLQKKGYTIIRRNFRYSRAEIDLIAQKDGIMVFVEVKKRSYNAFGYPEEAVNHSKERRIISAAEHFIYQTDWMGDIRFDIVSVMGDRVEHFEDAFH